MSSFLVAASARRYLSQAQRQRMPSCPATTALLSPSLASSWSSSFRFLSASKKTQPTTNVSNETLDDPTVADGNDPLNLKASTEPLPLDGEWAGCKRNFMAPLSIGSRGAEILHNPLYNKGTAFKTGERDRLRLRGLLPTRIANIHVQKQRFLMALRELDSNIAKNMLLEDLHDRNETVYHRILVDHMEEMAPLIYTPTVGQACLEFGQRFRRPRGMYFCEADRGHMAAMVHNWPRTHVSVIVVTDGSRILGLGDLGASGMAIPVGKLSLYCAAGGIPPHRVLPIVLDVGTNNEKLLNDPFYLGQPKERLTGDAYYYLIDEFMEAVRFRWPHVLVQFEDFSSDVAQTLLDKYRDDHLCFNDDIQGTGATALAGLLCAIRATGQDASTALGDQRIVIAGAGSAGIGIAQVLKEAMMEQGRTEKEAKNTFFVCDQFGLLGKERMDSLSPEQQVFCRDQDNELPLIDVIKKYKPTILLGVTAVGGLFTEELVSEMSAHVERPIILPLSNPTTKAECTAEQAYEWTNGRCIFASGSPFDPVELNGRVLTPSQCNNMYIFPGLGLGASVCGAKKVTDRMLYIAAKALANFVPDEDVAVGKVFPSLSRIRECSHRIAVAIVKEALREDLATLIPNEAKEDLEVFVAEKMYYPEYVPLVEKRELRLY